MYNTVIFDFDYTLGDTTRGIIECANFAFSQMGYDKQSDQSIINTIGLTLKNTFKVITKEDNDEKSTQFAKLFIEKADEVMVHSATLYDSAVRLLNLLKQKNVKTAIVTTKFRRRIVAIFEKFSLTEAIDVVVGSDDVKESKPSPEGLLLAIDKLNTERHKVLYIGDNVVDSLAAQKAGVDFVGVLTGTTTSEEFNKLPNIRIVNSLDEVGDLIFK
ncbi:MAG: HAD family hydrolase [Ruminococcaceae bacterium]|nr:HAD family hydrolase [Oscillospiraceae bacterium]